jgi:hypothetical protein
MVGPLLMIGGACQVPWQAFQSQLSPHAGSQKSPGHQLMLGPGCAWASVGRPNRPTPNRRPSPLPRHYCLRNCSCGYGYRCKLCDCPVDPCAQMSNCGQGRRGSSRHAATIRVRSGRFGTKRRFGLPVRQCGSSCRTPGTDPRHAGIRKWAADCGRKTVHRGRARGVPR